MNDDYTDNKKVNLPSQFNQYKVTLEGRLSRIETVVNEISTNHLKHIEDKIDDLSDDLTNNHVTRSQWYDHLKKDDDHEARIRFIEKNMWRWIGASSVISALLAVGIPFLLK